MKPRTAGLRGLLWAIHRGQAVPDAPKPSALAFRPSDEFDHFPVEAQAESYCLAIGYRLFAADGERIAIRADALERLAQGARKLAAQGAFVATPALRRNSGCDEAGLAILLPALGYPARRDSSGLAFDPRRAAGHTGKRNGSKGGKPRGRRRSARKSESPFAKLSELKTPS
jgi:hypothetical protein